MRKPLAKALLFISGIIFTLPLSYAIEDCGTSVTECELRQEIKDLQQKVEKLFTITEKQQAAIDTQQGLIEAQKGQIAELKLKDGLVAHYPFDGHAKDVSGHGHHGTVKGATLTADRFGNPNRAYHFDGEDDYIEIQNAKAMNPSHITISVWYFADKSFSGGGNNVIIHKPYTKHVSPHYQWHLGVTGDQYPIRRYQSDFQASVATQKRAIGAGKKIPDFPGVWYHIVMSFDGTALKLYFNGNLKSNISITNDVIASYDTNVFIGKHGNGKSHTPGIVDDIRIYNRALTELEIQALYKQPQFLLKKDK